VITAHNQRSICAAKTADRRSGSGLFIAINALAFFMPLLRFYRKRGYRPGVQPGQAGVKHPGHGLAGREPAA